PPSILDGSSGGLSSDGAPAAGEPDGGSDADADVDAAGSAGERPVAEVHRLRLSVAVDRAYFDEVVSDGEIDFPDPVPGDRELELPGTELHIGRTSESRAIHPDIDVAALTGDQAVSSRHAVLRVANDGSLTIVDVGSTNGTFLDAVDSEAITHGVPTEVKPGVPIYVGAWTRLTVLE
ncbi:MAG: FHA domain-containing protein, partial [Acidimicrobiales bacterium]